MKALFYSRKKDRANGFLTYTKQKKETFDKITKNSQILLRKYAFIKKLPLIIYPLQKKKLRSDKRDLIISFLFRNLAHFTMLDQQKKQFFLAFRKKYIQIFQEQRNGLIKKYKMNKKLINVKKQKKQSIIFKILKNFKIINKKNLSFLFEISKRRRKKASV